MLMNGFDNGVLPLLGFAMLGLAVVAFVFALMAREDAYRAADKQTKTFWLVILGITVLVDFFLGMLFLEIMASSPASCSSSTCAPPSSRCRAAVAGGAAVAAAATGRTGPTTADGRR